MSMESWDPDRTGSVASSTQSAGMADGQMRPTAADLVPACFLCFRKAVISCHHCGLIGACGERHLRIHRPADLCFPCRVEENSNVGRYLVATRNIGKKELILTERPLVVGPTRDRGLVCVGCLSEIPSSSVANCPLSDANDHAGGANCCLHKPGTRIGVGGALAYPHKDSTACGAKTLQNEASTSPTTVSGNRLARPKGCCSANPSEASNIPTAGGVTCPRCRLPFCSHACVTRSHSDPTNPHMLECQYLAERLDWYKVAPDELDTALQELQENLLPLRYLLATHLLNDLDIELSEGGPGSSRSHGRRRSRRSPLNRHQPVVGNISHGDEPDGVLDDDEEGDEHAHDLLSAADATVLPQLFDGSTVDSNLLIRSRNMIFTNSKSLVEAGKNGAAVFNFYSLMNHSCVANSSLVIGRDLRLKVYSNEDIKAGEEISTRYGGLNIGQPRRSQLLQYHWGFTCGCARCQDPTEFGLMTSGVVCSAQDCSGHLLPHTALLWRCDTCEVVTSIERISSVLRQAESYIKNNLGGEPDNDILERTLHVLGLSLHPNHYLLAQVKFVLLTSYSLSVNSKLSQLSRMIQLGEDLISLLQKLDPDSPCLSRVLRIMIPALMELAKTELNTDLIDQDTFLLKKTRCFQYVDMLLSCSRINK